MRWNDERKYRFNECSYWIYALGFGDNWLVREKNGGDREIWVYEIDSWCKVEFVTWVFRVKLNEQQMNQMIALKRKGKRGELK